MHALVHLVPPTLQQATANPLHHRLRTFTGKSGSISCGVTAPFSWVLVHTRFCLYPPRVYFPVLCKFRQLCGGVNDDLLQEGLCHTQVCCTQSPSLLRCPLLNCTSTGDTQTQFCLSLCGVSGSWCMQDLFEPSKYLWRVWDSILNAILPLLPSCWGLSFAHEPGVSPQSHSSATQLMLQRLPSCWASLPSVMGYLLTVTPALCSHHSSATQPPGNAIIWRKII